MQKLCLFGVFRTHQLAPNCFKLGAVRLLVTISIYFFGMLIALQSAGNEHRAVSGLFTELPAL